MKYKPKIYAQALIDSILDGKTDDKKITANFLSLLKKNQDIKKAGQILLLTEQLLLQKTGNKKVVLETARKIGTKNMVASFAKKGDLVEEKINPALIAGVKVIVNNEKQFDNSLLAKLNKI